MNLESEITRAAECFKEGQFNLTLQICERILQITKEPMALFLKAHCLFQLNQFDLVLELAEESLQIKRETFTIYLVASIHLEKGNNGLALRHYLEIIYSHSAPPSAYIGAATAFLMLGKYHKSIAYAKKGLALSTPLNESSTFMNEVENDFNLRTNRGLSLAYLSIRNYAESVRYINTALSFDSQDKLSWIINGYLKIHSGDEKNAVFCFAQALNLKFDDSPEYQEIDGVSNDQVQAVIYRGLGIANLHVGNLEAAQENLEIAVEMDRNDINTVIALFETYKKLNTQKSITKANRLISKSEREYEMDEDVKGNREEFLTRIPFLKKYRKDKPLITVYIWNPKHDRKPEGFEGPYQYRDCDYGHAAIKITMGQKEYYFSWFPSGKYYQNKDDLLRATPLSYGRNKSIPTSQHQNWLFDLYHQMPKNHEQQLRYMSLKRSDKEELHRSATFKFYFWAGLNVERMLDYFRTLYESDYCYHYRALNCCDVVLNALQVSLDQEIPELEAIKTSKMLDNGYYDPSDLLMAHRYQTGQTRGTKSSTVYKYCYLLGKTINSHYKDKEDLPPVIIRFNRWNKGERSLTKFDFDPLNFDPNWMTQTKKITLGRLFEKLANQITTKVIFPSESIQGETLDESILIEDDHNLECVDDEGNPTDNYKFYC